MHSCIICLDNRQNSFYNLCNSCNNFIVCHNCYNDSNIHSITVCPNCRNNIIKTFNYSYKTLHIIIDYYKYVIIHILINIIYSNIFLYYKFPHNYNLSPLVSTNLTHLLIVNNISNIIIIPLIFHNFEYYYKVSIIYSFVNIIYSMLFYITNSNIQLYYIYYIVYFYILTLFTFIFFTIHKLVLFFQVTRLKLIHNNILHQLVIYNELHNPIQTTQF